MVPVGIHGGGRGERERGRERERERGERGFVSKDLSLYYDLRGFLQ